MRRVIIGLAALASLGAAHGALAQATQIDRGKAVFQHSCVWCHAAMQGRDTVPAGTVGLSEKYNGSKPAVLEQRTDLTPEFVAYVVRHGVRSMPPFRPSEIDRSDLAALAAYLSQPKK